MIPDSTNKFSQIPDSRYWIPVFVSEVWFWIAIVNSDSLSYIPDSKALDSGFHEEKFLGFRNPDSLTWVDPFLVSGTRDEALTLVFDVVL